MQDSKYLYAGVGTLLGALITVGFYSSRKNGPKKNSVSCITETYPLDSLLQDYPTSVIDGHTFRYPWKITAHAELIVKNIRYDFRLLFKQVAEGQEISDFYLDIQETVENVVSRTAQYSFKNAEVFAQFGRSLKDSEDKFKVLRQFLRGGLLLRIEAPTSEPQKYEVYAAQPTEQFAPLPVGCPSQFTPLNFESAVDTSDFNLAEYLQAIGYITAFNRESQQIRIICTAFLVHENGIVMTARHALNGFIVNELKFHLIGANSQTLDFSFNSIIESGEKLLDPASLERAQGILLDYILLKLNNSENMSLPPPLLLASEKMDFSGFYSVAGYREESGLLSSEQVKFAEVGRGEALVLNYFANTTPCFSGAPLINFVTGKVVGIHCKKTFQPIAAGENTGLSIEYVVSTYPSSNLSKIVENQQIPFESTDFTYPLPHVTSVLEGYEEREEGGIRDTALGPTPALGSSHTYRCLLARWLLKGEEKIRFLDKKDGFKVVFDGKTETYVVSKGKNNMKITKTELEKQANGESIAPADFQKIIEIELVNRFFSPVYWEVNLKKSKDADDAKYHVREWVKLNTRIKSHQPAINMGHKLSANTYWIEGAKNYVAERLSEKQSSVKYKSKKNKFNTKKKEYESRYNKYEIPGHKCYGTSINEEFMRDSKNYRFEWHARNKSDGAKNKTGNYDEAMPPGLINQREGSSVRFVPK